MSVSQIVFSTVGIGHTSIVAVFDELDRRLGKGFTVVVPFDRLKKIVNMGKFKRKFIKRMVVSLSNREHLEGRGTSMVLDWSPTLPRIIAKLKPQVVITVNFGVRTLQALVTGFPTVICWEGWSRTEVNVRPWRKWIRRWMAKHAKAFIVNGSLAKSYLIDELGVPENAVFTGFLGTEPVQEKFRPVSARKVQKGQPINFLFVGQLIKRKGAEHLLKAAAKLKSRLHPGSTFKLTILGGGPEQAHLEELVSCLQLTGLINFIDRIPPSRIWEYYAGAHVFVLPTLNDNWPLVVPEAMSMGMPILLSEYAGSTPEFVQDGKNGFTFNPERCDELCRLMELYIERPELVEKHGEYSLELIAPYNPESIVNSMLSAANYALATAKRK